MFSVGECKNNFSPDRSNMLPEGKSAEQLKGQRVEVLDLGATFLFSGYSLLLQRRGELDTREFDLELITNT
jgi:hypothetical protein